ncbi:ATP-binding/permease protein CydD [Marinomonas spartinae]|uniref:ATP-binding/permease protein CydD n=1 Tax=Marinomonas spartinae TaxID=1792290 RepID=A0A1A8TN45_9GAMM|nr:thiol reductant ABC exporter subunit CydD [Marinomonas spartinae]SBS35214.1 ATP-binding/permease protein CydD [Marinomonas spartinae]SBS39482.1 ATP-binding/permease protein CydD [Marinomonas spartinae]
MFKREKAPKKARQGRVKTPELMFLNEWAGRQSKRYRLVQLLGVVFTVAMIMQAWSLANVFSDMVIHGAFSVSILFIALTALLIRALVSFGRERLSASASRSIRYSLREKLVSHLTKLGPARLRIEEDAALSTRVYEQVDALDDYYSRYKPQLFMVSLIPCVILLAMLPVSWVAFAIFMVTAPLVIFFMILVGHKAAQANRRQFNVLAMLSNQFMDLNQGLAELKRLGRTGQAKERLSDSASAYQKTTMGVLRLAFLSTATLELFASIAIAMIALYLGLGLLEQLPWSKGVSPVSLTQAFFILLLAPEFYLPLRQLGNDYHAKQKAEAAATALLEIFNTSLSRSEEQAKEDAQTVSKPSHLSVVKTHPASLLTFYKLSWQEAGRSRLAPISNHIRTGERIWLSGESGVGKSSLLHLLLGFEEGYQGECFVEDKEFSSVDLAQWRARLAWLPQTPEWVNGSIRQNLLLGIDTPTDEALQAALTKSQCDVFIEALPDGLETKLTELGAGLSGGQMQRLSIARALLSKADVWLLDEPCSGLDEETATAVLDTLNLASKGKTLLVVSHDTHPIAWADRHWTLTHGGLHEQRIQAIA